MTETIKERAYDMSRWDQGLMGLEKLCEFKRKSSLTRSEPLYYEMQYKYFKQAREAVDTGQPIIAHATMHAYYGACGDFPRHGPCADTWNLFLH